MVREHQLGDPGGVAGVDDSSMMSAQTPTDVHMITRRQLVRWFRSLPQQSTPKPSR